MREASIRPTNAETDWGRLYLAYMTEWGWSHCCPAAATAAAGCQPAGEGRMCQHSEQLTLLFKNKIKAARTVGSPAGTAFWSVCRSMPAVQTKQPDRNVNEAYDERSTQKWLENASWMTGAKQKLTVVQF